jgi:FAD dependent oxidoreductase
VLRAQSRLSWLETVDFTRELSPQVTALTLTPRLTRSLARRRFDFELGPIAKVMKSRDRTLDATRIATDLLNAFLASGGDLRTNAPVVRLERGWVHTTGESFRCRQVIAAAGRHTAEVAGIPVKVMKSPVLVVTPALSDINFIRMTPNVMESLNHLCHDGPDGDYSVIANAHYWPAEAAVDPAPTKTALLSKVEHVFGERIEPRRAALYFGDKTELIEGSRLRNYQYQILEGRRAVVVLPGKMSLAFSLAVNLCRHFGIDPATHVDAFKDLRAAAYVAPAVHLEHSRTLAQPDDNPGSPVHLAGVG